MSGATSSGETGAGLPAQESPRPRYKRSMRNFLLDRRFQLKYTLMIALSGGLLFGTMEYFFFDKVRENSELAGLTDDPAMAAELEQKLAEEDQKVLMTLVGFWLALVAMMLVVGILATHHIVGPIYVVDRYIQRIRNGQPVYPRPLRRGDEFQTLYNHVNEMAHTLRDERIHESEALELMLSRLSVRLETLSKMGGEAAELATRLDEELAAVRTIVRQKKTWLSQPEE